MSNPLTQQRIDELTNTLFVGFNNIRNTTESKRTAPELVWLTKWMREHAVDPATTLVTPEQVVQLGERIARHYFRFGEVPSRYVIGVFADLTAKA